MSKPRNWWYGEVKKWVMRYPKLKDEKSDMAKKFVKAIESTLEETKKLEASEYRLKAIDMVFFRNTHTIDGVAEKIHYSPSQIQRWLNKFINEVGRKAGY